MGELCAPASCGKQGGSSVERMYAEAIIEFPTKQRIWNWMLLLNPSPGGVITDKENGSNCATVSSSTFQIEEHRYLRHSSKKYRWNFLFNSLECKTWGVGLQWQRRKQLCFIKAQDYPFRVQPWKSPVSFKVNWNKLAKWKFGWRSIHVCAVWAILLI